MTLSNALFTKLYSSMVFVDIYWACINCVRIRQLLQINIYRLVVSRGIFYYLASFYRMPSDYLRICYSAFHVHRTICF